MADDDRNIIDLEQEDLIKKALNKATKVEILNDVIPAAFAAGIIYAYIRLHSHEYDGMEDVGDADWFISQIILTMYIFITKL